VRTIPYDRQDIPLHAFPGYIRSVTAFPSGDFIDLVDEDDAHLLGPLGGDARDVIHVDQLVLFFLDQVIEGLRYRHFSLFLLLAEEAGEHVLDVDVHLLDALIGDDLKRRHGALAYFDLHHALVELAFAKLRAQLVARAIRFASRIFGQCVAAGIR
jgi:hypothetical protein